MLPIRQFVHLGIRLVCAQNCRRLFNVQTLCKERLSNKIICSTKFLHTETSTPEALNQNEETQKTSIGKLEGKLKLMFTCNKCKVRNSKIISKLAYNKGVVIVRCDGCKNNHLIADNLGWFSEFKSKFNIEKVMLEKGETVRRISNSVDGYYEAVLAAELDYQKQRQNVTTNSETKEDEKNPQPKKIGTLE